MEKENCIEKPGNTEPEVLDFYRTLSKLLSREHLENNAELVLSLESKICIPLSLLFAHNQNPNSYSTILSVMNSYSNSLLNKSKPLFITSEYAAHWNTDFTDNEYKSKLSSQQNQKWKINLVKIIKIMFSNSELFIGLHFQKN